MSKKNNIVNKTISTQKNFSYAKGEVSLNFSLTIDNDQKLKDFMDCLIEAQKDITKILIEMNSL